MVKKKVDKSVKAVDASVVAEASIEENDQHASEHDVPKSVIPKDYTGKLPDDLSRKWMTDIVELKKLWDECKNFKLDVPYLVELGWDEPFFGSLSKRILKTKTASIPTAGVRIVDRTIEMLWNPIFFKKELEDVSYNYPRGVLEHELYHLIFEHVTTRIQTPHVLWNVATDLAINSLIKRGNLPDFALVPGECFKPKNPPPDWKPSKLSEIILKLPKEQSSEWYMNYLLSDPEVQEMMDKARQIVESGSGDGDGQGDKGDKEKQFNDELGKQLMGGSGGQIDSHDGWGQLSDAERDMMRDYIRDMFRDCVKDAESRSNGWGNVPDSIRSHLKKLISKEIDWRELLAQFIGRSRSTQTTSSIKRLNRRAPWDFPGRKRSYSAKPAIAFDQSGSMADEWVELFFAELSNLGNVAEYDIIPFDYTVDEENIQSIRRGVKPNTVRTRSGGTSFDAVVKYINEKKAGEYDAVIFVTDGGCSEPSKCKLPVAYVLAPGCDLMFKPAEGTTVIKMTDTRRR